MSGKLPRDDVDKELKAIAKLVRESTIPEEIYEIEDRLDRVAADLHAFSIPYPTPTP